MRAAIFLDRDGVLNEPVVLDGVPHPPDTAGQVVLSPGAQAACQRLRDMGYLLVCVTNQPDIARGQTSVAKVDSINDVIAKAMGLDAVYVCPHDDHHACDCRKPLPGLLLAAAKEMDIDLTRSVMVGDRWRDIDAGRAAGVKAVYIDRGYSEKKPIAMHFQAGSLLEAVPWIETIHRSRT